MKYIAYVLLLTSCYSYSMQVPGLSADFMERAMALIRINNARARKAQKPYDPARIVKWYNQIPAAKL